VSITTTILVIDAQEDLLYLTTASTPPTVMRQGLFPVPLVRRLRRFIGMSSSTLWIIFAPLVVPFVTALGADAMTLPERSL
jgi:hypothetical protein